MMTLTINNQTVELDSDSLDNLFSDLTDVVENIQRLLNSDRSKADIEKVLAHLNDVVDVYS